MKFNKIDIHRGIGPLTFGMTREEVVSLLDSTYVEEKDDDDTILLYDDLELECTFWNDEDGALGIIETSRKDMTLLGQTLYGMTKAEIVTFIQETLNDTIAGEDSAEMDDGSVEEWIDVIDSSLTFWFTGGVLSSLILTCQWDDDEPQWPNN